MWLYRSVTFSLHLTHVRQEVLRHKDYIGSRLTKNCLKISRISPGLKLPQKKTNKTKKLNVFFKKCGNSSIFNVSFDLKKNTDQQYKQQVKNDWTPTI